MSSRDGKPVPYDCITRLGRAGRAGACSRRCRDVEGDFAEMREYGGTPYSSRRNEIGGLHNPSAPAAAPTV